VRTQAHASSSGTVGVAALGDADALAAAALGAEALAEARAESSEGGAVAGAPAHPTAARSAIPSARRAVPDAELTFRSKVEHA
jgi:hypothetical protein